MDVCLISVRMHLGKFASPMSPMGMASGYSGIQAGDIFFMARNSWQEFKSLKSKPGLMKALQGHG